MSPSRDWVGRCGRETAANLRNLDQKDLSFGRWVFHCDDADWYALIARHPELDFNNPDIDADMRSRNWKRFLKSSASEPYRTGGKI